MNPDAYLFEIAVERIMARMAEMGHGAQSHTVDMLVGGANRISSEPSRARREYLAGRTANDLVRHLFPELMREAPRWKGGA